MTKILFLGDSITDSHRLFINPPLGCGYVSILSEKLHKLGYDVQINNLGVDGFSISRLLERCETQYAPLHADITTVLIGINDIGLMMNTNRTPDQRQQMMAQFFSNYEKLLHSLPHTQLILLEPFIFPYPAEFRTWIPFVSQMSDGIAALADQYHLPYIRLHDALNEEGRRYGMDSVTLDGIHLTSQGHEILAEKLLHTLESRL